MTLSSLMILMPVLYILLVVIFGFSYDINNKVAKGFLVASILLVIAIILLGIFLTFTYSPFYIIVVLLYGFALFINIKTLKKLF